MIMPLHPSVSDIAVRLILTVLAGGLIGLNREARGHAAGFRTTILVTLAASVAMIQANILLPVGGKETDSFGTMDLMRLPLGILTGVGFIGGGAILRRGDLVSGVTTAATLWVATVIGLCFGGGQIWLGIAATFLALITLWALGWLDVHLPREHRARLDVVGDGPVATELQDLLKPAGYRARLVRLDRDKGQVGAVYGFEIRWTCPELSATPTDLLKLVASRYQIRIFDLIEEGSH